MFAVIKAGGKQYKVAEDQVLKVEGVKGEPGTIVQLGDVIMAPCCSRALLRLSPLNDRKIPAMHAARG